MRKTKLLLQLTAALLLSVPVIAYSSDSLAEYQSIIDQARSQPAVSDALRNQMAASNNAQAGVSPAPAFPALTPAESSVAAAHNAAPAAPVPEASNNNKNNQPPAAAPAGPPNIFITPGSNNTTNNQGGSIIHY